MTQGEVTNPFFWLKLIVIWAKLSIDKPIFLTTTTTTIMNVKNHMLIMRILYGMEPIPLDSLFEIINEIEENPAIFLTTGQACSAFEQLQSLAGQDDNF